MNVRWQRESLVRFLTFHLNSRPRGSSLLPPRLLSVLLSSTRTIIHVWVPTCATISMAESRVAIQRALGGDQLGGPSLCGSCSGESVSPASSPTRTHPFLNCGEKDRREDFSDLSTRGCLQIPDGRNEEKDFSQWPCRALDPGRGLTSGSAGSSLNTLCSSCTSNVLLIQPLPPLPPSVLWLSPSAYFVLHDTGTSVSSLSALMLFCCKPVSPICSTNRAFAAWFTVTAPLPGLYKASHSKHVLHSRKLHNTRPWMIYAEKGSLPVSKKTTFLGGGKACRSLSSHHIWFLC